jgi:hypothetical protein
LPNKLKSHTRYTLYALYIIHIYDSFFTRSARASTATLWLLFFTITQPPTTTTYIHSELYNYYLIYSLDLLFLNIFNFFCGIFGAFVAHRASIPFCNRDSLMWEATFARAVSAPRNEPITVRPLFLSSCGKRMDIVQSELLSQLWTSSFGGKKSTTMLSERINRRTT